MHAAPQSPGLAGRTAHLRIETRARNAVTLLWPDAAQTRVRKGSIAEAADAFKVQWTRADWYSVLVAARGVPLP